MFKRILRVLIIAVVTSNLLLVPMGCSSDPVQPARIKNIVLVIGDGMGFPALGLLRDYSKYAPNSIYRDTNGKTNLERAMETGRLSLMFTESMDTPVVDSAAAASQIATGKASPLQAIGSDDQGNPVETVLELAKRHGKATGLVSDTRITHATPASFASHVSHRGHESAVARQLISKNGPDVMLSGGLRYFVPNSAKSSNAPETERLAKEYGIPYRFRSKRNDNLNLLQRARSKYDYELVFSRDALKVAAGPKLLGLFSYSGMQNGVAESWQKDAPETHWPTLSEMTAKALEILEKDPDGFFLMVEAGQIDWAEHNQDAGQLLHEMIRLDRTIETVVAWAAGRDDTAVIITADHDTGGFAMTYTAHNLPNKPRKLPGKLFENGIYQPTNNFGSFEVFDTLYNQKQSYMDLLSDFGRLDEVKRTPQTLVKMVRQATGVEISTDDALAVMRERLNPYRVMTHRYLREEIVPDVGLKQAFYTNTANMLGGILASRIGIAQNISWATGTHSSAPVPMIMLAPDHVGETVPNVMHSTDLGNILKKLAAAG